MIFTILSDKQLFFPEYSHIEMNSVGCLEVKFTMLNLWQEVKDNRYIGSDCTETLEAF